MKIAIIGGGFTGLTAAYELTKAGHNVTVFERDEHLGGLAWGFKQPNWQWHLEAAYHHMFTNDDAIIGLINELGIGDKLIIKRPITANLVPSPGAGSPARSGTTSADAPNQIYQLDSPDNLLRFPGLSLMDKFRTGALAAFCKVYPFWQTLEGVTAKDFFAFWGGSAGWRVVWEPLMTGKFGHLDNTIAASWLWARIHKRTPSLAYIEGGFQTLVNALTDAIIKQGGIILTSTAISSIEKESGGSYYVVWKGKKQLFDRILLTVPTPIALKLLPIIPDTYTKPLLEIPHLHAQILILETDKPIINNVYWLSITDRSFPFLAVVAHTNFMDKSHYGGHHLTYIGNYLPPDHPFLTMTKEQLLKKFLPYIKRLSPTTNYKLLTTHLFTAPYAQPVHQLHYSKIAPKLQTSIPNVYLANLDSIYPWDRGTNYAVELGMRAARAMSFRA